MKMCGFASEFDIKERLIFTVTGLLLIRIVTWSWVWGPYGMGSGKIKPSRNK